MYSRISCRHLKFLLPMIFLFLLSGISTADAEQKDIGLYELSAPGVLSTLTILSPTPDTILYDCDTALYYDPTPNTWTGVRFTPLYHFELQAIYFGILNQYNNTTDGCSLYVVEDDSLGFPDWPSGVLASFWVAPPVPDRVWLQVDLSSPIRFSASEDFHIIYGPAPGGPYPGPGWWDLFDSDGTTTQRSYVSHDNRQTWITITNGDAFIRAGGIYFGTPSDFSLGAHAGSYAPWGRSNSLVIDSLGHVAFSQTDLTDWDSVSTDSIFALLTPQEMQTIYDTVTAVGFFSLDSLYHGGMADGSGIFLNITANGTENSVEAINIAVQQVNRIAQTLNTILGPFGIQLDYGWLGGKEGR